MKKNIFFKSILVGICLLGFREGSFAQSEVHIPGYSGPGNQPPVWVSMSGFTGEAASIIQFDLIVQGFNFTNADNAQYLISGGNNGNLQGRVMDRYNKSVIVSKAYSGASIQREVHAFVDEFVKAIGRVPIAETKIAFKSQTGSGSEIRVADFDGFGAQAVSADNSIVAAPAWIPRHMALLYTSYKLGNPDIFYHDLSSGSRRAFARFSGLNTSAAVSPDGGRVAMILSKGGSPDVYVCNVDGGGLLRLTATPEDESTPTWSTDGEWIYYATKAGGRRTLSRIPAGGGHAQRVSTPGILNPTSPSFSPDGKWLAFTEQTRDFTICVMPATGGQVTELVPGEDPSWSPNSRTLVYTRREAGGGRVLSLLDVPTKQYKDVSRLTGNNSQPSWAK
jgi:TolB protein